MILSRHKVDNCEYMYVSISNYLDPNTDDAPNDLMQVVTPDDCKKASQFHSHHDGMRSLLTRYFLRKELGARLILAPHTFTFQTDIWGKPMLQSDLRSKIKFNVSRSWDIVAMAFAPSEVGIDIEYARPIPEQLVIINSYFTSEERNWFMDVKTSDRDGAFLELWTRKEALYKAMRCGLRLALDAVAITPGRTLHQHLHQQWQIRSITAPLGYVAALSWQKEVKGEAAWEIQMRQL